MEAIKEKIESLLAKELEGTDCFLVEIKMLAGDKIQVFIDCDSGITVDRCAKISRYLESHLDESEQLSDTYTLEVSSPGVGQPLKLQRQYKKNIGRTVNVKLEDNNSKKGILKEVTDEHIVLEEKGKKGKGKKKETINTEIPFNNIKEVKVLVTF